MAEQEALTLTSIDLNNVENMKLKLMKKPARIVIGNEKDQDCPMDAASRTILKLTSELCCDNLKILKIIPTIGNQDLPTVGSFSALASLEIEMELEQEQVSEIDLMPISQLKNLCFLGLNLPSYEYFHSEGEKLCEIFSALPKLEMLSIFVFMPDKQTAVCSISPLGPVSI